LGGTLHEYNYSARLRSKFIWVDTEKHIEDRRRGKIRLSEDQRASATKTKEFMRQICRDEELGCSPFDIECLATAFELKITLVTESDIRSVVTMWTYDEDLPAHFPSEFIRLFGEQPD